MLHSHSGCWTLRTPYVIAMRFGCVGVHLNRVHMHECVSWSTTTGRCLTGAPRAAPCRIELKTGALLVFPSWVQTSILVLPPAKPSASSRTFRAPVPPNHVAQADREGRDLGFAPGFAAADAAPPPLSAAASILHLALPGDPTATAAAVVPLRVPTPPPTGLRRLRTSNPDMPETPPDTPLETPPQTPPQAPPEPTPNTAHHSNSGANPGARPTGDLGTCDIFETLWYMYGSPVSVHNLEDVDPDLDLVVLRELALTAFDAFRRCFKEDGNDAEHGYPGSLGDDLFAYQSHWPNTRDYPCTAGLKGAAAAEREEEWQRAFSTYVMGATHQRMLTAGAHPHHCASSHSPSSFPSPPRWLGVQCTHTHFCMHAHLG